MKNKYLVLSVRQLKQMLAVAEQVRKLDGVESKPDSCCMIYGVEESAKHEGQLILRSVRAAAAGRHYEPTVLNETNSMGGAQSRQLISYSGKFTTGE
jgi:hypothetical protein